eukprot:5482781-Pyramimonas_sp.AAC.1
MVLHIFMVKLLISTLVGDVVSKKGVAVCAIFTTRYDETPMSVIVPEAAADALPPKEFEHLRDILNHDTSFWHVSSSRDKAPTKLLQ